MGCVPCGPAWAPPLNQAQGSPVARWQVTHPNGQTILYLNEAQAHAEAARVGSSASPYALDTTSGSASD